MGKKALRLQHRTSSTRKNEHVGFQDEEELKFDFQERDWTEACTCREPWGRTCAEEQTFRAESWWWNKSVNSFPGGGGGVSCPGHLRSYSIIMWQASNIHRWSAKEVHRNIKHHGNMWIRFSKFSLHAGARLCISKPVFSSNQEYRKGLKTQVGSWYTESKFRQGPSDNYALWIPGREGREQNSKSRKMHDVFAKVAPKGKAWNGISKILQNLDIATNSLVSSNSKNLPRIAMGVPYLLILIGNREVEMLKFQDASSSKSDTKSNKRISMILNIRNPSD